MQLQHPCRKTVDPRFFFHITKNFEVFEFFSIRSWISLNVTQKISKCLNGRNKCPSNVPVKKFWPNGRKCFAHVETFWTKCKNVLVRVQKWKKGKKFPAKNHRKNLQDTRKAVEKSSVQKFLLKSNNYFSENRKKPQNFYLFFQFLLLSKLILWTHRMHLSQCYHRLLEVGLFIHAWFFFDKRTKKCRSRCENYGKVLTISGKKNFRIKMSSRIASLATPLKVSC